MLTGQTFGRAIDQPGVRHLGHVAFEELPALYRGARAVVFPSLFEGFGAPVLEAMACGTPVAASDRGALAEVAGEAALLFDPESSDALVDAVGRVTADASLRARLIELGLARASGHTWARTAGAHLRVYSDVARSG